MVLPVQPLPATTLASQIAAVVAALLLLRIVRLRPLPAMRPSMVTLSAPLSFTMAPAMDPSMMRAPPEGVIETDVYAAAPAPLLFKAAVAVSVVLATTLMVIAP